MAINRIYPVYDASGRMMYISATIIDPPPEQAPLTAAGARLILRLPNGEQARRLSKGVYVTDGGAIFSSADAWAF